MREGLGLGFMGRWMVPVIVLLGLYSTINFSYVYKDIHKNKIREKNLLDNNKYEHMAMERNEGSMEVVQVDEYDNAVVYKLANRDGEIKIVSIILNSMGEVVSIEESI